MKKKVLQISCGGLGHGGVSTVIFSIVENLYKKYDFDCIVFKKRGEREEKFKKYGNLYRVNCYNTGKRSIIEIIIRPFVMFFGIYNICKKNHYDIIHAHNDYEEGICLFAAKCAGVRKRIAHSHNTSSPKDKSFINRIKSFLNLKLINRYATNKIGCSKAACEDFFKKNDYHVIFNSIDLGKFKNAKKIKRHNSTISFIHVGRYTYQKNQEFVIRVFSEIEKINKNVILNLVGFGPDETKLRKVIEDLNLQTKVFLVPGDKVDVVKEYSKSDYMIFPSTFEGFGIVLIEAQAMGIHCFVAQETIQKEVNVGLLDYISLKKTPKEWANIIMSIINKNEIIDYSNISNNLLKFNISNISEQYDILYKED